MSCDCYRIGGPFITYDPDCLIHAPGGEITTLQAEAAQLRSAVAEAVELLREKLATCVECRGPCEPPCWACRADAFIKDKRPL